METNDSHCSDLSDAEDDDLASSVTFSARNMFQHSPKSTKSNAEQSASDTSAEFQKLMEPFKTALQMSDSRSEENSNSNRNSFTGNDSCILISGFRSR